MTVVIAEQFSDFWIPIWDAWVTISILQLFIFQKPSLISIDLHLLFTGKTTLFVGWRRYPSLLLISTTISIMVCSSRGLFDISATSSAQVGAQQFILPIFRWKKNFSWLLVRSFHNQPHLTRELSCCTNFLHVSASKIWEC